MTLTVSRVEIENKVRMKTTGLLYSMMGWKSTFRSIDVARKLVIMVDAR
jgi:hypothetical protein